MSLILNLLLFCSCVGFCCPAIGCCSFGSLWYAWSVKLQLKCRINKVLFVKVIAGTSCLAVHVCMHWLWSKAISPSKSKIAPASTAEAAHRKPHTTSRWVCTRNVQNSQHWSRSLTQTLTSSTKCTIILWRMMTPHRPTISQTPPLSHRPIDNSHCNAALNHYKSTVLLALCKISN